MADGKNKLVTPQKGWNNPKPRPMEHDPYVVDGNDFPVKSVMPKTGQGGKHGSAEGENKLATHNENQDGPRHIQDKGTGPHGSGTPSDWGEGMAARISAAFPIQQNSGESDTSASKLSIEESVNVKSGYIEGGLKRTRVQEVPESKVKYGA